MEPAVFLDHALQCIAQSRETIRRFWGRSLRTQQKSDLSIVSEADIAAEKILRSAISEAFPHHGIIGEELDPIHPESPYQWILDPIDGTQNFVSGIPTFGTILGLHVKEGDATIPILGIIDHPALDMCIWAGKGLGTFLNGKRVTIPANSNDTFDKNEILSISTPEIFQRVNAMEVYQKACAFHGNTRTYYDIFGETMVACGRIALGVSYGNKPWDIAATQILIEEAGGKFVTTQVDEGFPSYTSAIFGRASLVDRFLKELHL